MDDLPAVEELAGLRALTARLRAENARLLRLVELSPKQAAQPGPAQTGFFDGRPGPVNRQSPPETKVAFFAALFTARTDIYATRWENTRAGKAGWLPAARGGWRKGLRHEDRDYLPLTTDVLRTHLTGETHAGLYPLLNGDTCWWLAADFDGQTAMLDALAYLKAARAWSVPAALEVSRSGVGAHAWVFFTAPLPAESARKLGTALLREAMAVRGQIAEAHERGGLLPTVLGAVVGAVLYTGANVVLARRGARQRKRSGGRQPSESEQAGSGTAIALGALLDGVPESMVIGTSLLGGGVVSVVTVVAVFISNVPEGLSSAAGMRQAGRSRAYVFGLWVGIAVVSGLSAMFGYVVLGGAPPEVLAGITALAGGAILAMIADTMIPEAFEDAHLLIGLITVTGFLVAFGLSSLEP